MTNEYPDIPPGVWLNPRPEDLEWAAVSMKEHIRFDAILDGKDLRKAEGILARAFLAIRPTRDRAACPYCGEVLPIQVYPLDEQPSFAEHCMKKHVGTGDGLL